MTQIPNNDDYELMKKAGALGEQAADAIESGAVKGYKAIETGVVKGYKMVESSVVGAYDKIETAFVDRFLKQEGETVEQAKTRLKNSERCSKEEKGSEHERD